MLQDLWQDVLYSARTLIKHPKFSLIVVLTLAFGIGVNTAICSIAEAILLRPASIINLDRIVMLLEWAPQKSDYWNGVAPANFADWKQNLSSVENMAAYSALDATLTSGGDPERVQGYRVSANFFQLLGEAPMQGRGFNADEENLGRDRAVIISQKLWENRYGSSLGVLQHGIQLNGKTYIVIGIMGKDFRFPPAADLWVPLAMSPTERNDRWHHSLIAFGLLKHGKTAGQAQAELDRLSQELQVLYPATNRNWTTKVLSLRDFLNGSMTWQFLVLTVGAALFVLLIACINVGNLQLVRSTGRSRELAVKLALGAKNGRIIRALLTDSIVMALAGGLLSLVFAQIAIKLLLSYSTAEMSLFVSGWNAIRLDKITFCFALVLAIGAGLVSGLAPALRVKNIDLNDALKQFSGVSGGRRRSLWRNTLVVVQVGLSFALLTGAVLMAKGFQSLSHMNDRFDPHTLATMRIDLSANRYRTSQQKISFYEQVAQKLSALPGVSSTALASSIPFGNRQDSEYFYTENGPEPQPGQYPLALVQSVSPEYFHTLHIGIEQGRQFSESDVSGSEPVVMVSRKLADRSWPGQNPIGRRLKLKTRTDSAWRTVVGIVEDIQYDWTDPGPEIVIYAPYRQLSMNSTFAILRSSNGPGSLLYASSRSKITEVDAQQPVFQMKSLEGVIHDAVAALIYVAAFVAILGMIAIILTSTGIYGVLGQVVNERMQEIRLRLALGAQPMDVAKLILKYGAFLMSIGLGIGLSVSFLLGRILSSMLASIRPMILTSSLEIAAVLVFVSALTCYLPARHASSTDPGTILREN